MEPKRNSTKKVSSVVRRVVTVPKAAAPVPPREPILVPAEVEPGPSELAGPVLETLRPEPPTKTDKGKGLDLGGKFSLGACRDVIRPIKKEVVDTGAAVSKEIETVTLESDDEEEETSARTKAQRRRDRRKVGRAKKEQERQRLAAAPLVAGPQGMWTEDCTGKMVFLPPGSEVIRAEGFFAVRPASEPVGSTNSGTGLQNPDQPGTSAQAGQETIPKGRVTTVAAGTVQGEGKKRKAGEMAEVHRQGEVSVDGGDPGNGDIEARVNEGAIMEFFRYDRRPYSAIVLDQYPDRVDVSQTEPGSTWFPLRVRAQRQELRYYDLPAMAGKDDAGTELLFVDLDIYLMYSFFRLRRLGYYAMYQETNRRSEETVCRDWWRRYEEYFRGLDTEEAVEVWKEVSFIMACAFVLRRAFKEDGFRRALLSLGVHTEVVAFSLVLNERYGEVLRWVRMALLSQLLPAHPAIFTRYLVGDTLVNRWVVTVASRAAKEEEAARRRAGEKPRAVRWERGVVGGFRVLAVEGADIRTGAWLTQGVMLPNTQAVVWCLGTYNVEAVPDPTKDDRTPEEREKGPSRTDRQGRMQYTNYPDLVFTLMYHARVIARVHRKLQRLFIMEVMPRFCDVPELYNHRILEGDVRPEPKRVRKIRDLNRLMRELVAKQKNENLVVLATYALGDDPEYYRLGDGEQVQLEMWDYRRMWAILQRVAMVANGLLD